MQRLLKSLHTSELQCKANDKRAKHCYNSQCTRSWGNPLMLLYSESSDSGQLRQSCSKFNLKQRGKGGQENPGGGRDSYIDILFMRYDQRLEISELIFSLLVFKPIRRCFPSPLHTTPPPPTPLPPKIRALIGYYVATLLKKGN